MNNEVRKKVLLDLFGHPTTLFPAFGSAAAFILAWATAWNPVLLLGSILSGLVAAGAFATRLAVGGEELFERQKRYIEEQELQEENEYLDDLDERLCRDRDPRDQTCLREIRSMVNELREQVKEGELTPGGEALLRTVKQMFDACVVLLEESYAIYETYKKMEKGTDARNRLKAEREKKIVQCLEAADHLRTAIKQFHEARAESNGTNLDQLRRDLDRQIEVARKVGRLGSGKDEEFDKFVSE